MDRWALLIVAVAYIGFFPFFPKLHSANELSRLYLSWAIVYDHSFSISHQIREFGNIGDKSIRQGRYYSDKPPGIAFMSVLPIYVRSLFGGHPNLSIDLRLARLFATILPGLLLLLLMHRFMLDRGVSRDTTAMVIIGFGLGSLLFTYSVLLYSHITTAFFLFLGYFLLFRPLKWQNTLLIGLSCGAAVNSEYQAALYCIPIAIYGLVWARRRPLALLAAVVGAAIPIGMLAFYQHACFGSVFKTSYSFVANPYFASIHRQGFMGVVGPHLKNIVVSLFSLSKGMFFYSPLCLLGAVGLFFMRKKDVGTRGRLILSWVIPALPFLFVASMIYYLGGWTVSQRHLTPLVPFFALPLGLVVDRYRPARLLLPGLVIASVIITGLSTIVFPHLPESFANPLHQLVLPLAARGCFVTFLGMSGKWWGIVFLISALAITGIYSIKTMTFHDFVLAGVLTFVVVAIMTVGSSQCYRKTAVNERRDQVFFVNQFRAAGCKPQKIIHIKPRILKK